MKNIRFLIIVVLLLFFCVIIYKNNTHDNLSEDSLAFYIDDELSNTMPGKNDGYDFDHAVCTNGASITWDSSTWSPKVNDLVASRTKCTLYFSTSRSSVTLAALNNLNNGYVVTPSTSDNPDFSIIAPRTANVNEDGKSAQTSGVFALADDYGTSYYLRGDINYNYVKFGEWQTDYYDAHSYGQFTSLSACESAAGSGNCTKYASAGDDMYWRIIRINGDGSIRMIYDGVSAHGKEDTELDPSTYDLIQSNIRSIGGSGFSLEFADNAGVGYMYGTSGSNNYNATHANTNDSEVKQRLDSWYQLQMTSYSSFISDTLFCNDRSVASSDTVDYINSTNSSSWSWPNNQYTTNAYADNWVIYGAYERIINQDRGLGNQSTFTCPQQNDRFTVNNTSIGNGALTYPVGLITGDELNAAGVAGSENYDNYLFTGSMFFSMTPHSFFDTYADVFYIYQEGYLDYYTTGLSNVSVRPVINIKGNAITSGAGTAANPFTVS